MPKIQGIDEIQSTRASLYTGIVPVGGIIAIHETRFSLGSGVVLSGGFMLCDGAAIPPGQTLSGNTPNITNTKFLRGFNTAGDGTNNNNRTLNLSQLPNHNHTATGDAAFMDHSHVANTGAANIPNHNHAINIGGQNAPHSHRQYWTSGSGGPSNYRSDLNWPANETGVAEQDRNTSNTNAPHYHSINTGAINAPHSHNASVGTTNTPHSHSGNTGSTGLGQTVSITPQYVNTMFIIRVI